MIYITFLSHHFSTKSGPLDWKIFSLLWNFSVIFCIHFLFVDGSTSICFSTAYATKLPMQVYCTNYPWKEYYVFQLILHQRINNFCKATTLVPDPGNIWSQNHSTWIISNQSCAPCILCIVWNSVFLRKRRSFHQ